MTLKEALNDRRVLLLDGGMGTMLQAAGMPAGISPDKFCLENPAILRDIHLAYIRAGADIITTCTFGANKFKLDSSLDCRQANRELARIAKSCASSGAGKRPVLVAGDVGPTGFFPRPLGDVEPEEMIAAFAEQIQGLHEGGVDIIFMETQFDLAEVRAAVVAARRVCSLPVMVSMTFEDGRTLTGSTPEIFAETMQNMNVASIGTNCSLGPLEMAPVVDALLSVCQAPVLAEPNAGLPQLVNGFTVFPLPPEPFARETARFAEKGAKILGGCCGTTPAHIAALKQALESVEVVSRPIPECHGITLTSRSALTRIGQNENLALIGERINPTGKAALADELVSGNFHLALKMAKEQVEAGAQVLDVNVGAPLVREKQVLPALVCELVQSLPTPLALDSSDSQAIAEALPYWPGSCLVNSVSGEKGRMETLGPLCRDFGAPFILLPIKGADLPETARQRIRIIEKLLEEARALGIPKRLIMVDLLALSVSASPQGGKECLKMLDWCRENGFPSTIGLSNISFGMPARPLLNSVFLAMARGCGLSSCIANPGMGALRQAISAMRALEGSRQGMESFIDEYANWKPGAETIAKGTQKAPGLTLYDCVLHGDRENMESRLEERLKAGMAPMAIINDILIPAINEVGDKYAKKEFFLPQLIRAAETMKAAFGILTPMLREDGGEVKKPVIVLATVQGDIHDIGKNIVALLLGNHGFEVVDAGKDVPASVIVDLAERHGAFMIGLSALMTTTMTRMEDTIKLLGEKNLRIPVIVGGAAVTEEFARSIGAFAYCETAVDSVNAAKKFLSKTTSSQLA